MLDMVKGTIILKGDGMKKREQLNNSMSFFVCVRKSVFVGMVYG